LYVVPIAAPPEVCREHIVERCPQLSARVQRRLPIGKCAASGSQPSSQLRYRKGFPCTPLSSELVARRLSESRQANWISQSGLHKNDPALNGRGHEALLGYRHFPAQSEGSSKRNRIAGMRWVKENLSRILRDFFPRHSGKSEGGRG
jgi:hypothetical protein